MELEVAANQRKKRRRTRNPKRRNLDGEPLEYEEAEREPVEGPGEEK